VNALQRSLLVGLAVIGGCGYNTIQTYDEQVNAAESQIKVQLQRRADLVPNLVETVKGYAKQEQTIFTAVADARARMAGATTPTDKIAAANAETSALGRLFVVVENYPQHKSDATFARLMDEVIQEEPVKRRHAGHGHQHLRAS